QARRRAAWHARAGSAVSCSSSHGLEPPLRARAPPGDERALRLGFLGPDRLSRAARGGGSGRRRRIVPPRLRRRLQRRAPPSCPPLGSVLAFRGWGWGADVPLGLLALGGNHGRAGVRFRMAAPAAGARLRPAAV